MLNPAVKEMLNNMRVVLASSSIQRRRLLESVNLHFDVYSSTFEENLDFSKYTFSEYVEETALAKVLDVFEKLQNDLVPPDVIIGADTMVTYKGKMYGKPANKDEAFDMIKTFTSEGFPSVVYSGVVIKYKNKLAKFCEETTVYMCKLTDEEIDFYVETGEPFGKAGGYGIQGLASTFIEKIEGDYVIGLPLCRLSQKLKEILL